MYVLYIMSAWLAGITVMASDLQLRGSEFNSDHALVDNDLVTQGEKDDLLDP